LADSRDISININANDQASKALGEVGKAATASFKKVAVAAAAGAAAIQAMAIASVKRLADVGEQIQNFSTASGFAASAASSLSLAATGMGLSLESVAGSSKKMQVNLANMADDTKKANAALKPLGITFKEIKDLSPEEQFIKLGNAVASIKDPAERTAQAVKIFGKSGTDLIPLFNGGTASLEQFNEAAKKAGVYMDEGAIAAAAKADEAFDGFNATLTGLTQTFAIAVVPAVTALVDKMKALIEPVTAWMQANPELTGTIVTVTTVVLALIGALPTLISTVTALNAVFMFLAANPLTLVVAGLAAFGAAMVYLWNTNEQFRTIVTDVWGYVSSFLITTFEAIKTTVEAALTQIVTWWTDDHNQIKAFFLDVWNFLSTTGVELVVTLATIIMDSFRPMVQFFQEHWDAISFTFQTAWNVISTGFQIFWNGLLAIGKIGWETIKTVFKVALDLLKGNWAAAWEEIKTYFVNVFTYIGTFGQTIMNLFSSFLSATWDSIKKTFLEALTALQDGWTSFWASFQKAAEDAVNFVKSIIQGVTDAINNAINALNKFMGMGGGSTGGGGTQHNAMGGRMAGGGVSVVGEKGTRLF